MDFKKARLTGVAAALAVSAGTVLLTPGSAGAATCEAPSGASCVAVVYQVTHVKSIRVDGRCLIGQGGTYSKVHVVRFGTPEVQTYGGSWCEGGTQNSASVRWGSEDSNRFRWVRIA